MPHSQHISNGRTPHRCGWTSNDDVSTTTVFQSGSVAANKVSTEWLSHSLEFRLSVKYGSRPDPRPWTHEHSSPLPFQIAGRMHWRYQCSDKAPAIRRFDRFADRQLQTHTDIHIAFAATPPETGFLQDADGVIGLDRHWIYTAGLGQNPLIRACYGHKSNSEWFGGDNRATGQYPEMTCPSFWNRAILKSVARILLSGLVLFAT